MQPVSYLLFFILMFFSINCTELNLLQGIHCMGHVLELGLKDAVKEVPLHRRLDELLLGLYYFYHNSPLNRANLKRSTEAIEKKSLMPTRVGGTRWLGHTLQALTQVLKGYSALVQHLGQVFFLFLIVKFYILKC